MTTCPHSWILYDLKLMGSQGECGLGILTLEPSERSPSVGELLWHELWFCPDCRKIEFRTSPAEPA